MHSSEKLSARLTEYADRVCDMEDILKEAADNVTLIAELAFYLKKDQTVVLYGKDVTEDYYYRMEHTMNEMSELNRKRTGRFDKMRQKGDLHFDKIIRLLPPEISRELNVLFIIVQTAVEMLSSIEPSKDLSEALGLISETMDAVHELKTEYDHKGALTPEMKSLFTEVQNLLFEFHGMFLNEQQQRKREDDLLTPEFLNYIKKLEAMPRELLQTISDCTKLRLECEKLEAHIIEIVDVLNESEPAFKPVNDLFHYLAESEECYEEEAEEFYTELAEIRLFVADMTAMGRKFKKATADMLDKLKKARAAFDYYAGELD